MVYERLHVANSVNYNRIYITRIDKNGLSSGGKKDVTQEAFEAVASCLLEIMKRSKCNMYDYHTAFGILRLEPKEPQ